MMKRIRHYDYDASSSESEEFHRRKLRLKVKIPEESCEDDNDSPQPPQPSPERRHFCLICNKQFRCGKAYGGHVRVHSSEYSSKGKTKKMKMKMKMKNAKKKMGALKKDKEKETDLIRADVEGKIKCCLCGKEFQTIHSLFGHMRRHPDRSWEGIRPPPTPEKFKLSFLNDDVDDNDDDYDDVDDNDDDYDDVDDDDDAVMSRSMMISNVTEDVLEAACILMMIYNTSSNYWLGMKKDMKSPNDEVTSSICYKDDKVRENVKLDVGMVDDNGSIVDMKINMMVDEPREEAKRSLGFDLNQTYHEDHTYIY